MQPIVQLRRMHDYYSVSTLPFYAGPEMTLLQVLHIQIQCAEQLQPHFPVVERVLSCVVGRASSL